MLARPDKPERTGLVGLGKRKRNTALEAPKHGLRARLGRDPDGCRVVFRGSLAAGFPDRLPAREESSCHRCDLSGAPAAVAGVIAILSKFAKPIYLPRPGNRFASLESRAIA
jgi:hypothetical protein